MARQRGGGRVSIPGCGSAYEARTFAEKGYDVVAIDFSPAAVERQEAFGLLATNHVHVIVTVQGTPDTAAYLFRRVKQMYPDISTERLPIPSLPE